MGVLRCELTVVPLYEAALLTARLDRRVRVALLTPEQEPLEMFGDAAVGSRARRRRGRVPRRPAGPVRRSRMPTGSCRCRSCAARGSTGVPTTGPYELIPIDPYGRVDGLDDVYAVGDATDYPLKQGGIACQQADTAAAHVAGLRVTATVAPFQPQVRATLLTGGEPIELGDEAHARQTARALHQRDVFQRKTAKLKHDRRDREPDDAPSGAL